jgi:mycothiol synthase
MAVPAPYRFRAPRPDDFADVAAVLAEDDLDDAGEVVLDEGFLQRQWERPGFGLATDAWVAVDRAEAVVAYGQVTHDDPDVVDSWGIVRPSHRGFGLGAALVELLEGRAPALATGAAPVRLRNAINAADEAAARLLESRGYRVVRHFWHMRIDVPEGFHPGDPPAGISFTALRSPDDLPLVHAVLDQAFADHWGHEPEPFEQWADYRTTGPSYDPALWRVAWDGERILGALIAVVLEDRGWVDLLGVQRSARGRGIAAALLRRAFAAFAGRGVRVVYLAVDAENPTGATALYERQGMRVVKRFDLWEKPLG